MKNVASLFALAAGLLTVSGCGWFGGDKKVEDTSAEHKSVAVNDVAAEAVTTVASAEGVEQSATEEQKIEEAPVATAEAPATMPMNEEKAA